MRKILAVYLLVVAVQANATFVADLQGCARSFREEQIQVEGISAYRNLMAHAAEKLNSDAEATRRGQYFFGLRDFDAVTQRRESKNVILYFRVMQVNKNDTRKKLADINIAIRQGESIDTEAHQEEVAAELKVVFLSIIDGKESNADEGSDIVVDAGSEANDDEMRPYRELMDQLAGSLNSNWDVTQSGLYRVLSFDRVPISRDRSSGVYQLRFRVLKNDENLNSESDGRSEQIRSVSIELDPETYTGSAQDVGRLKEKLKQEVLRALDGAS